MCIRHIPHRNLELWNLLVIPLGKLGRNSGQITEQLCSVVNRPSGEILLCCGCSGSVAVAGAYTPRTERPDSIDRQGLSAGVLQKPSNFPVAKSYAAM